MYGAREMKMAALALAILAGLAVEHADDRRMAGCGGCVETIEQL